MIWIRISVASARHSSISWLLIGWMCPHNAKLQMGHTASLSMHGTMWQWQPCLITISFTSKNVIQWYLLFNWKWPELTMNKKKTILWRVGTYWVALEHYVNHSCAEGLCVCCMGLLLNSCGLFLGHRGMFAPWHVACTVAGASWTDWFACCVIVVNLFVLQVHLLSVEWINLRLSQYASDWDAGGIVTLVAAVSSWWSRLNLALLKKLFRER